MSKLLAQNKKARHDYFIEDTYEAGIVLEGHEVKSIRASNLSIKESYIQIKNSEIFIYKMHVKPFEMANYQIDPLRIRKLLLHKREIKKLEAKIKEPSYTLIALRVYLNDRGLIKIAFGLCRGKKLYDKRQSAAKKDAKRQIERVLKNTRYK